MSKIKHTFKHFHANIGKWCFFNVFEWNFNLYNRKKTGQPKQKIIETFLDKNMNCQNYNFGFSKDIRLSEIIFLFRNPSQGKHKHGNRSYSFLIRTRNHLNSCTKHKFYFVNYRNSWRSIIDLFNANKSFHQTKSWKSHPEETIKTFQQ